MIPSTGQVRNTAKARLKLAKEISDWQVKLSVHPQQTHRNARGFRPLVLNTKAWQASEHGGLSMSLRINRKVATLRLAHRDLGHFHDGFAGIRHSNEPCVVAEFGAGDAAGRFEGRVGQPCPGGGQIGALFECVI